MLPCRPRATFSPSKIKTLPAKSFFPTIAKNTQGLFRKWEREANPGAKKIRERPLLRTETRRNVGKCFFLFFLFFMVAAELTGKKTEQGLYLLA